MDTQKMLDNAATGSQAHQLLEPETRGAVLRSVHQWIGARLNGNPFTTPIDLLKELEADEEYEL